MSKQPVRLMSLLMVVVVLFTFSVCSPAKADLVYVNTSPFIDLSTSHWSIHNIIKMNIRAVVMGYTDGSFQPDKPVTQLEAILMAVRNMGAVDEIAAINSSRDLALTVPSWASQDYKKELLFALDQGLIQSSDGTFVYSTYASRAWMARLMVRMIDQEATAAQLDNQETKFTDNDKIPSWAVGYVNASVKHDLVSGYPDNSFRPLTNVTRAETVALLSRSESHLDLDDTIVTGRITSIQNSAFIVNVNGTAVTLNMDADTWAFDEEGNVISWTKLEVGDTIHFIASKNTAQYIEVLPAPKIASSYQASVIQVITAENVLIVKDANNLIHTLTFSDSVSISNQSGNSCTLDQLEENSSIELGLDSNDNLISIVLLTQEGNYSSSGILYEVNESQKLVILKDSTGQFITYPYDDTLDVIIEGVRFPSISDLQTGDEIKVSLSGSLLQEIKLIKTQQELSISGKLVLISADKQLLAVDINGAIQSYYLANDATITIPGIDYAVLTDLYEDDTVDLQITDGEISALTVTNRMAGDNLQGTILAVDTRADVLVILTSTGEIKTYTVNDAAKIFVDNTADADLLDLGTDMSVEYDLIDNEIIYLEAISGTEGTVVSINSDRNLLILLLSTGKTQTYILDADPDVNIVDESGLDLADVAKDDHVQIILNNDDEVTEINVKKAVPYTVVTVYETYNKLKVEDEDGVAKTIYLTDDVDIEISGISSPDAGDFEKDDVVSANYIGDTLKKITLSR